MKGIVTRWKKGPKELISKLVEKGVDLEKFTALEMFGRGGTWHTSFFANKVRSIEIWEIDKKWGKKLKNNFPNAKIRILDSIKTIKEEESLTKFNLLLIDNPMNIFGQNQEGSDKNYCEHFEILSKISKIIQDESLVIFNINRCPFDYDKYPCQQGGNARVIGGHAARAGRHQCQRCGAGDVRCGGVLHLDDHIVGI